MNLFIIVVVLIANAVVVIVIVIAIFVIAIAVVVIVIHNKLSPDLEALCATVCNTSAIRQQKIDRQQYVGNTSAST